MHRLPNGFFILITIYYEWLWIHLYIYIYFFVFYGFVFASFTILSIRLPASLFPRRCFEQMLWRWRRMVWAEKFSSILGKLCKYLHFRVLKRSTFAYFSAKSYVYLNNFAVPRQARLVPFHTTLSYRIWPIMPHASIIGSMTIGLKCRWHELQVSCFKAKSKSIFHISIYTPSKNFIINIFFLYLSPPYLSIPLVIPAWTITSQIWDPGSSLGSSVTH